MEQLEKWISNLNKQQKLIIGIAIPLLLLFLTLKIADVVTYSSLNWHGYPFKFGETWWVWLFYIIIVGVMEFKLFENKK